MQQVLDDNEGLTCAMGSLACQSMSRLWGKKFSKAGLDVEIHHGTYADEGHTWLEVDGIMFDPTASQFDDFPDMDEDRYEVHEIEEF